MTIKSFVLVFISIQFISSLGFSEQLSAIQRINFQANQLKEINKDQPITDAMLSSDGAVWFTGKNFLWQWVPKISSLKRVRVNHHPTSKSSYLQSLSSNGRQVFVASNDSIYKVSFGPIKVVQFDRTNFKEKGSHLGFGSFGDQNLWVHSTGIFTLDLLANSLKRTISFDFINPSDKVVIRKGDDKFYIGRNNKLYEHSLKTLKTKSPQIETTFKGRIEALNLYGDLLVAHDQKRVFIKNLKNNVIQSIPVASKRNLVRAYMGKLDHVFLFSDGVVELMNLRNSSKSYYKIESSVSDVKSVVFQAPYLATVSSKGPTLYKLTIDKKNIAKN